ncbi:MAG: amino acid ABC transporter ATP-binding protein [Clostridia bacterium]|nr:amino acid ABC transporter ATP-binding protein [Clostridia bacterium]
MENFLEVRGLSKSFNGNPVLKGIDFSLEAGQILSVIGSSGGGKTTLLRCLNFLETPEEGTISVNGEIIFDAKNNVKPLNGLNFGLVFQQFNLFPQYSVKRNITLAPAIQARKRLKKEKASKEEVKAALAEIDAMADRLLKQINLSDKAEAYPTDLSGGQQQRVAIARALALEPSILCFDEPTSALDPELTGEVLRVIKGLKDDNRTMIIVTHEMEFARNVSDKVIFMANGVIEEMGTPEEVFVHPKSETTRNFLFNSKNSY